MPACDRFKYDAQFAGQHINITKDEATARRLN